MHSPFPEAFELYHAGENRQPDELALNISTVTRRPRKATSLLTTVPKHLNKHESVGNHAWKICKRQAEPDSSANIGK